MSGEPQTEAGRALLAALRMEDDTFVHGDKAAILAIEAEAIAQERERLAALPTHDVTYSGPDGEARIARVPRGRYVLRDDVLQGADR